VRNCDARSWFGAAFARERVPTLAEAVALLAELGLHANIELKSNRGRETATGTIVAALLAGTRPLRTPRFVISSFRLRALAAAAARAPEIPRGILFRAIPGNWRMLAERLGCSTVHAGHDLLRPAVVSKVRQAGYPLLAYTVNDPERAQTLFDWGVTSVFSDTPQRFYEVATPGSSCEPTTTGPNAARFPRQGSG
jgi:glycerophosphoryl diester phosphodiesterase